MAVSEDGPSQDGPSQDGPSQDGPSQDGPSQDGMVDAGLFDVCGPLPAGTTVLEASAGTGKTFTIAALAARYVAEGTPLERLLLVTFTRMATGELRERVRERLLSAETGLGRALGGVAPPEDDLVLCLLAGGPGEEVALRRRRMAVALADFDAATISTTHGFCQHILSGLGVAGDVETDVTFVDDAGDLISEVVDDLYVRRFFRDTAVPPFKLEEALRIAKVAVANSQAPIEPRAAPQDSTWAMRRRLAVAVRAEVDLRKRRRKILTYDDLLSRLASTLRDPVRGPAARQRLRERYAVALVDEFQDTDPVQWEIMRRAFSGDGSTLVLIGDPKQAIYAFRGADVFAYLEAARQAGALATLGTNWRSDQGLIDAYDALLGGTKLGNEGIAYRTVRAAAANQQPRLVAAPRAEPLRARVAHRCDGLLGLTANGFANRASALTHVARDLARDMVELLSSPAEVVTRRDDGSEADRAGVSPGNLAVLVRTHRQAALVRDALADVGIPAVINGAGSVFETAIAREWLVLLEALERPASPVRAHAAALTVFVGWNATKVAMAGEDAWEGVFARLHRWAAVLRHGGVASLAETVTVGEALPGRLLAHPEGEREMTDLRHVGQLLHLESASEKLGEKLGVTALAAWLRHRIAEAAGDTATEERSRRLESDAEAVQVLTIHRSKGLEFPIVYYPYLWDPGWLPDDAPPIFHDPGNNNQRTVNVGLGGPGFAGHRRQYLDEQRGEDLRLAYVALTRARHQAVVWWASTWESRNSALSRMLFCRDAAGNVAAEGTAVPEEGEVVAAFEALAAEVPGRISVERTTGGEGPRWPGQEPAPDELVVSRFGRTLDVSWRRTSYSAITSGAHEAGVTSEPEETGPGDEALAGAPAVVTVTGVVPGSVRGDADEARLRAVPSPLASMPAGPAVGSLVHAVLEVVDFASPNLDRDLAARLGEQQALTNLDLGDAAPVEPGSSDSAMAMPNDPASHPVVAGLRAAIDTPLGPLLGGLSLRQFGRAARLNELDFELPLAGGDLPGAPLPLGAVARLLRERLPPDDVLAGYPDRLGDPELQQDLRGYLAGSIDLVLRVGDGGGNQRFVVVDYKTNRLAPHAEPLTAWHYRHEALVGAMVAAHYPLQALLYSVALHRYLRWRLPGYDPARHLGGVAYLFLRGMTGPWAPHVGDHPSGVFAWLPPSGLVGALSDLLDQGGSG